MAYANFKPTIWSKQIQNGLSKFTVFADDCDYKFSAEAGKGKTVRILGVARPTIGDYTGANIGNPEIVSDSVCTLAIDQAKFFNFQVDDVDAAQAVDGLMQALITEAARAMAEQRDAYIASLAADSANISAPTSVKTSAEARAAIDKALVALWEKGVNITDSVTMYLTPWFYDLFHTSVSELKTSNDSEVSKGILGLYRGVNVKMSNNISKVAADDLIMIKSSKAIAFCGGIDETEAYRPQGLFCDAVKGLNTYGAKIVRPNEMYVVKAHNS